MNAKVFLNDLPDNLNIVGDIAIDTEAMGLKLQRDRLCVVQICDETGSVFLVQFPDDSYSYESPNLKKLLLDSSRQKIFHFARFDVAIMRHYLNLPRLENIYCTKIASRFARTYTDSHSLRALVAEIMKIDLKKEQQSSYWGAKQLSEAQIKYAASDVIYLHAIRNQLNSMLELYNRKAIAQEYFNFLNVVCESDMLGFNEEIFRHMT
jgi:ribonuclease D